MPNINIVYPIDGATYPVMDPPAAGLKSAYFTSSFGVTEAGGPYPVEWGFDTEPPLGSARYYDQMSAQFVWKLPGGKHRFWVRSGPDEEHATFQIG